MRQRVGPGFVAFVFVLLICLSGGHSAGACLRGGCARINITPPIGIPLIGSYGKPSESVLDDLYVRAMVLDDGHTTVAIVSADLLYTPLDEICRPVRRRVEDRTGIPQGNILICATHTHSGPEVFTRSKIRKDQEVPASSLDQAYLQALVGKMAECVAMARADMRPVKIGAAVGLLPEIVFNRRPRTPDGLAINTFTLPPEAAATRAVRIGDDGLTTVSFALGGETSDLTWGPVDPELRVLRVVDANDRMVGSLVNFACHPVCVYPHLPTAISADYPGDATELAEQVEGGVCLFTLGAAGDIVPYQRGLEGHRRMGRAVGAEAIRRLQFVPATDNVTLAVLRKDIEFPVKQPVSTDPNTDPEKPAEVIRTEMQVLRLGDIYLLGLPGEVLTGIGLEIKKRAGLEHLFVISLANDAIGYVCHSQAYEEKGYEPGQATQLAKGAGEIMVAQALELIKQMSP